MEDAAASATEPDRAAARRTVGGGASLATIAQVFTALGGGLAGVVVARFLGPAGTGSFNLLLSLLLILLVLAPLGLEYGISYYVGRGAWRPRDARPQLLVAATVQGLAGAVVGVVIVAVGASALFPGVGVGDAALGLAALPFGIAWLLGSYLALAVDRYEAFAVTPAVQAMTLLAATAALAPSFGFRGAIAALVISNAAAAVAIWWLNRRVTEAPAPGWLRRGRRDLASATSFGIRGTATAALGMLVQRADLYVVGAVASRATTGYYAVALSLTTLQAVLPRALSAVTFPRVSALDAGEDRLQEELVLVKAVRHAVLLAVASGVLVVAGAFAIPLVYGSDFTEAIPIALILVPGGSAFGVTAVLTAVVLGKGAPGLLLRGSLMVTPVALVLYVVAGVWLGVHAVAATSSVAYFALMLVAARYFARVTGLRDLRLLLPGREELADYAALAQRALAGRRAR